MCTRSACDPGRPVSRTDQSRSSLGRLLIPMCLALVLPSLPAYAACYDGTILAESPAPLCLPKTASDGAGGSYVVWLDTSESSFHLFALRVDSSGRMVSSWPAEGLLVTTQAVQPPEVQDDRPGHDNYNICVDSRGRLVIVWASDGSSRISAQRISAGATPTLDWGPDGMSVFSTSYSERHPVIAADEDGGCFIAAEVNLDIYVQRINNDGTTWGAGGRVACNAPGSQIWPSIAYVGKSNSIGYAVIAWADGRNLDLTGIEGIFGQLVDWNGVMPWNSDGRVISSRSLDESYPIVCRGNNPLEAYVVWSESENQVRPGGTFWAPGTAIYAQRLYADGSLAWGSGLLVRDDTGVNLNQVPIAAVPAPDGVTLIWDTFTNPLALDSILAERLLANGSNEGGNWASGGKLIAGPNDAMGSHSVVGDGAGGFAMSWRDQLNPGVYATRFSPNGDAVWSSSPNMSHDALGANTSVTLLAGGGLFVAWAHAPNTDGSDNIYEQATSSDGSATIVTAPSRPRNVATNSGCAANGVTVTWIDVCNATLYRIYRSDSPDPIAGVSPGIMTFTDRNNMPTTPPAGSYQYCVRSYSASGGLSDPGCATGCMPPRDIPLGINLVGQTNNVPDSHGACQMTIRDASNNPIANVPVTIDFSYCPHIEICPTQGCGSVVDATGKKVTRYTDGTGRVTFTIIGKATRSEPPDQFYYAYVDIPNSPPIAQIKVAAYDQDGGGVSALDLSDVYADVLSPHYYERSDFDWIHGPSNHYNALEISKDYAVVVAGQSADGCLVPESPPASPPARASGVAVYDPVGQRMIVFGGVGSNGQPSSDTWAVTTSCDNLTWNQVTTDGTPPSYDVLSSAIYDPVRDRMIVYGGTDENVHSALGGNTLFQLQFDRSGGPWTWSELADYGTEPPGRFGHSAVYDPVGDRMIVYGGQDGPTTFGDTWELQLSGPGANYPLWSQLSSVGSPGPRYRHTATYDPVRQRMVVAGGYPPGGGPTGGRPVGFLYLPSSGDPSWSNLGLSCRDVWTNSAIYDPQFDRILSFGGYSQQPNVSQCGDLYVYSLNMSGPNGDILSWDHYSPSYTAPGGDRYNYMAVFDPYPPNNRMILFGGYLNTDGACVNNVISDDTYSLELEHNLAASTWKVESGAGGGSPAARIPTLTTQQAEVSHYLKISPNPIRDKATIAFSAARDEAASLKIFDVSGRLVKTLTVQGSGGARQVEWDSRNQSGAKVASGIYFVEVGGANFSERKRVIVLR